MTHRGPFQPLLFCDSVILLFHTASIFLSLVLSDTDQTSFDRILSFPAATGAPVSSGSSRTAKPRTGKRHRNLVVLSSVLGLSRPRVAVHLALSRASPRGMLSLPRLPERLTLFALCCGTSRDPIPAGVVQARCFAVVVTLQLESPWHRVRWSQR